MRNSNDAIWYCRVCGSYINKYDLIIEHFIEVHLHFINLIHMKECVFDEGKVTCNRLVKIFEKKIKMKYINSLNIVWKSILVLIEIQ